MNEGCPECIQQFWISQEPVMWPWCNLAASQRRPYCVSVNSCSPMGLVIQQWDADDWACVLCDHRIHNDRASRSTSSWQCACPFYSSRAGYVTKASYHQGLSTPPTAQIWLPATYGFSQSWNCKWKRGDWWMWQSHSTQTQSTASHCRLTSPMGCAVRSPLAGYQVTSRLRDRFSRHSKWTHTFRTALIQLHPHINSAMNESEWPVLWAGCWRNSSWAVSHIQVVEWNQRPRTSSTAKCVMWLDTQNVLYTYPPRTSTWPDTGQWRYLRRVKHLA